MTTFPEFDHRIDPAVPRDPSGHIDGLGRQKLAQLLAQKLLSSTGVVGLYGTWGSGKSYVLDLTIDQLFNPEISQRVGIRPIVCYFQPWLYEPDSSLAPGLILALRSVRDQFKDDNPPFTESFPEKVSRLCDSLWTRMRKAVAPLKPFAQATQGLPAYPGKIIVDTVAAGLQAVPDPDSEEWDRESIRTEMTKLIGALCADAARSEDGKKEADYRVVVVIDDLDRCAPDLMVDMLNWLKVHLSVGQCSYLLALDHEAAARAIVGRYREYLSDPDLAYGLRYLEKIVGFEVELSRSDLVERMAVTSAEKEATSEARPAAVAATSAEELVERALRRQGVRSAEIRQLMRLPTLQSPRTMLKVMDRFRQALQVVQAHQQARISGQSPGAQFPADYQFWLLLLVAMYYRLAPPYIEAFCDGGEQLAGAVTVVGQDLGRVHEPVREFDEFLRNLLREGEAAAQRPSTTALSELYAAVRQLTT
ncbi:MAG: KAP family P-loop NTPase fold protein, partial [Streptosporangiaceae bacterium]